MILVNERVVEHLKGQQRELGALDQLLDWGAAKWSKWWDAARGLGRKDTIADLIKAERANIAEMTKDGEPAEGTFSSGRIQAARLRLAMLAEQAKQEGAIADARSAAAATTRQAIADERKNADAQRAGGRREQPYLPSDFQVLDARDGMVLAARREKEESEVEGFFQRQLLAQEERDAKRQGQNRTYLQALLDTNRRAGIELIEDERARGEALIAFDRDLAQRRLEAQGLEGSDRAQAEAALDEFALQRRRQLEVELRRSSDGLAADTGRALYADTRSALAEAFRETSGNPLKAFGNALANTIYTRATASMVDALATAAVGADGRGGGLGALLELLGGTQGGGMTVDTGGYGITDGSTALPTRGGMATGTNYVPRNMVSLVHEGEAIVPKRFNPWAGGSTGAGVTVNHTTNVSVAAGTDEQRLAGLVFEATRRSQEAVYADLHSRGILA